MIHSMILSVNFKEKVQRSKIRMHSSRMRTGRSLTVCRSLLPGDVCSGGRGCLLPGGGLLQGGLLPGGCLLLGEGCLLPGGCLLGGCLLQGVSALGDGGVCSQGGVCSWGVSAPRGWVSALGGCGIPACTEADTPL